MASLTITDVHKRYGQGPQAHAALQGVSLAVAHGEFIALLGPSGSGKTSLLRAIAGLEDIDAGRIEIAGEPQSTAGFTRPPERRGISVVFQNHALWPHLSVFDNVAFPLREQGRPAATELRERVERALAEVGLQSLGQRHPGELSGGQKQRVALARAMVGAPRVILFDEPLASLDLELRWDMLRQIARLRERGITMVYVTHNQEEALALADRVAVLAQGRLQQLARPEQLVREPATAMVARFVGGGNLLPARVRERVGERLLRVEVGGHALLARCARPPAGAEVMISVAQTAIGLGPCAEGQVLPARLQYLFYQGHDSLAEVELADGASLQLRLPAGHGARVGDALPLHLRDAWILPETPR
ncbi:ABC transporter ATP-binding protein [Roseateles sp. DAIF2]|uniref:ABC transporter ATP-binding protein n=1 Tax=Roseateles sp. DAIF2 TaxID=2714952 RepID=UPI0018A2A210|nr:ABC transporter ATP-binding protein [Roseateles sp. DAIF2]QPF76072.1 ABC transporter ATP-binding protein [Roseateles sp. DAIF2]